MSSQTHQNDFHFEQILQNCHRNLLMKLTLCLSKGHLAQMVECSLRMREVPGSNPCYSQQQLFHVNTEFQFEPYMLPL